MQSQRKADQILSQRSEPIRPSPLAKMKNVRILFPILAVGLLAGCATGPQAPGINDPLEPMNRAVHGVNKGLDTALVRPISIGYGTVVPDPVRRGVSNVADNLSVPSIVVNDLLQGDPISAANNTLRFAMNLTLGLGGLLDFASAAGMPKTDNDFGTTLAVWGMGEGAYLELPLKGPSTVRDAVGFGVDVVTNPVGNWFDGDDATAVTAVEGLSQLDDRYRYLNTVDQLLYESADSYAQLRLLYLQNRRFQLGQAAGDDDLIDPYEDPYAE